MLIVLQTGEFKLRVNVLIRKLGVLTFQHLGFATFERILLFIIDSITKEMLNQTRNTTICIRERIV